MLLTLQKSVISPAIAHVRPQHFREYRILLGPSGFDGVSGRLTH